MHSRIFQISKNPIPKSEYISEDKYYDSFFLNQIADYVDEDTNREDDIEWLSGGSIGYSISTDEKNRKYIIVSDKREYFKHRYDCFKKYASKISSCSFDEFVNDSISSDLYQTNQSHTDKYGFYIDDNDEYFSLIPFDTFIRECEINTRYYIGSTIDYHS